MRRIVLSFALAVSLSAPDRCARRRRPSYRLPDGGKRMMRIAFGKLFVVAAAVVALVLTGVLATPASADSLSCEINGSINLHPGLSETPTVQSVKITNPGAKLTNCTGTETIVTGGSVWVKGFGGGTRTKEAITCQALKGPGAALEAPEPSESANFRWHPKIPGDRFSQSGGFMNVPITEMSVSLSGTMDSNTTFPEPFQGDKITGSVTEKYNGTCGGKAKVKKGAFTGTITIS